MRLSFVAALALTASPLHAQTAQPATPTPAVAAQPDYSIATPVAGEWVYSSANGISEAKFLSSLGVQQLAIRCTIATRRVTIAKAATGAAPYLNVWTTSQARALPSSFLPASAVLSADVGAYDPLLDAIAFSRGRIAVGVSGEPALVVPAWAEPARVVEDCRA
jgi:hypothetical protein